MTVWPVCLCGNFSDAVEAAQTILRPLAIILSLTVCEGYALATFLHGGCTLQLSIVNIAGADLGSEGRGLPLPKL